MVVLSHSCFSGSKIQMWLSLLPQGLSEAHIHGIIQSYHCNCGNIFLQVYSHCSQCDSFSSQVFGPRVTAFGSHQPEMRCSTLSCGAPQKELMGLLIFPKTNQPESENKREAPFFFNSPNFEHYSRHPYSQEANE